MHLIEVVEHWWNDQLENLPNERSPNVHQLWSYLVDEYAYSGSYKSVRKFVRERFPAAAKRPFRRIETPAGAQMQSDWLETNVRLRTLSGASLVKLYGFIMTLSHSRKTAVIWSESMAQLAWHHVHNEAFKRLGGIAAVNRIDNLKTGAFKCLDFARIFDSVAMLQRYTDETLQRDSVVRKCPVTGESVHATWMKERELLRPLPATMPEPFDLIKQASVYKDCTVRFEGRTYAVPYRFAYKTVEVRGCSGFVQIVDPNNGLVVKQFPRKTRELLLIDQDCYEPEIGSQEPSDAVPRPLPLGRIARQIDELASQGVAMRSIDFYAAIAAQKSAAKA